MNSASIILILFLPLAGGLIGYFTSTRSAVISAFTTFCSFIISLISLFLLEKDLVLSWIWLPDFVLSILIDRVSLLLISLVTLVSFLVQVFSAEYMKEDVGIHRFYAKLGLFVSSMIGLLIADNLLLLFVFWELVGLASYLLIGFWYKKEGVPKSAKIAFMVNRVADAALLAGIILTYDHAEMLSISSTSGTLPLLASLLISFGAFGKSAQLPFSGWLTKAMVGPTPVSALIHAATMVAAGVYLLYRVSPILQSDAMVVIAVVGSLTAIYAAFSAIIQFDIKKVLAYSTISQLGYMILGIGVGAREASLFHLFTHAFFKAGLFLGAAAIIHYLHSTSASDPQDMREMGGLKKNMPWTFRAFLVCALALAGLPFFSGFMSKDGILLGAWSFASEMGSWAYLVPDLALITALLTAFYVGRMVLLVFFGEKRFGKEGTLHEHVRFRIPLIVLSLFSVWIFHNWNPVAHDSIIFQALGISGAHFDGGKLIPFLAGLLALVGLVLAFSFFKPGTNYSQGLSEMKEPSSFSGALIYNGFFLNSLYEKIGQSTLLVSKSLVYLDQKIIDTILHFATVSAVVFSKALALVDRFFVDGPVNLMAAISVYLGKRLAGFSSRDGQTQIAWLLVILILILTLIVLF